MTEGRGGTRAALVVGGGTGIGAAVAQRLAREGYGVGLVGRRREPLEVTAARLREDGAEVVTVTADAGRAEDAGRAVDETVAAFGGLDVLVYNAGITGSGSVLTETPERWAAVLETNLTGAFLVTRAAMPSLIERRGALVTIASTSAYHASTGTVAYCASKAGLLMLTRCVALDSGPQGLRANCVCPGWVRTPMADTSMDGLAGRRGVSRDEAYAVANAPVPLGRPATPEEIAEVVVFAGGSGASYLTGAVIPVDGGGGAIDVSTVAFSEAGWA
ncbi:MAG: 3-oxoacyl-[acyl-carrier protein] reductase [uncultured Thermoleophilia bacterium]|uniref:3-oxoacyl-[acyl-carrier protein] reductase n=1 Tax=uncultured Thermoleophilia bacterium TaxID=1497501 RepID=A0A6J4TXE2_9ACTN|nr:MAG: 3-oxoacyl-[acyl-carrier protein] reductase [uncultured Thermoleophilia bacterium]